MANSTPPKGERRQGTGALPKYARGMAPTKPKQGPPAPKPAAKAKAGEAARNGKSSTLPARGSGEAARSGRATTPMPKQGPPSPAERRQSASPASKPAASKAYSKYRQDALDYMAKVPGGTAQYAGELQRLQKEGSYDKRYGQSPNQRAADATKALATTRKKSAVSNKAEKTKANRNRGADL